jgi:hypothetical protein
VALRDQAWTSVDHPRCIGNLDAQPEDARRSPSHNAAAVAEQDVGLGATQEEEGRGARRQLADLETQVVGGNAA